MNLRKWCALWHPRPMVLFGLFLSLPILAAAPCRAELVDRIAAVVNEDIILQSELDKAYEDYQQMLREAGHANQPRLLSRAELLEHVISDKLVDQESKRLKISIADEEVTHAIQRIQQVNKISDEEFGRMLAMKGMTREEYRNQIKQQIMQSRIVTREVRSKVVITEEELKNYYQQHSDQYAGSIKYHLRQILMKAAAPEEREQVYQSMQQLHERLKKGESFAELARNFSQARSAVEGGDLGSFESRQVTDQIRKALAGLGKGGFTDVIDTEQGFQLFYVEDVDQAAGKSFDEVKEEIHEKLAAQETEQRFEEWFKELKKRAHIEKLE